MEEIEIKVFNEYVFLGVKSKEWSTSIKVFNVDFKVSLELIENLNSEYKGAYLVKVKTSSGLINQFITLSVGNLKNQHKNGILEKVLLRSIFSRKVTDCIIYYSEIKGWTNS